MEKECYVKCASNEQAQALRPYLVEVGFVEDKRWNDGVYAKDRSAHCVAIYGHMHMSVNAEYIFFGRTLLHTVHADADLAEAAKTIKELFDKL